MALAYYATSKIYYNNVLAYNIGDLVPDANVTAYGYVALGLVEQLTVPDPAPSTTGVALLTVADANATFSAKSKQPINLLDFAGVDKTGATDSYAGLVLARAAAVAQTAPIYIPAGAYLFLTALNNMFPFGLVADGIGLTSLYVDTGAGTTAFTVPNAASGFPFKGFSVLAGSVGQTDAQRRAVVRNGIYFNFYGGATRHDDIQAIGYNGFGVKYEAIYDSFVDQIRVIECGNAAEYAFSVVAGTDTSNETLFSRVQVELAHDKAVYLDPANLNTTVEQLHAERFSRTTTAATDVSHVLSGAVKAARIQSLAGAGNTALVTCGPGTYEGLLDGGNSKMQAIGQVANVVTAFSASTMLTGFDVPTANIGTIVVGTSRLGPGTVADQPVGRLTVTESTYFGNVSLTGNGSTVTTDRCVFADGFGILEGAGNTAAKCSHTRFDQPPSLASAILDHCEVRNANAVFSRFNGQWELRGCDVLGNAALTQGGAGMRAWDSTFAGDLTSGGGNPLALLFDCRLTKVTPTVDNAVWVCETSLRSAVGGTAATTLGAVVRKVQVYDANGTSLGYVPVYDAIT